MNHVVHPDAQDSRRSCVGGVGIVVLAVHGHLGLHDLSWIRLVVAEPGCCRRLL